MRKNIAMRPETLLPMVRAALERGEGPPAVLAWMKANGLGGLCTVDETRVRAIASRLAESLSPRSDARTLPLTATYDSRLAG